MTIRTLGFFALCVWLSTIARAADNVSGVPSQSQQPNILFIISDDLATRVGCYGDEDAITPNIDRLASDGLLFERAYVQGTVCTPSRTSFMLGLNNRSARRNHFRQHPDTLTMGRFFKQHGYQTFSIGKIDHTEEFVDPAAWDIRIPNAKPKPSHQLEAIRETSGQSRLASRFAILDDVTPTSDYQIATRACQFLKADRAADRPFFAAVGFHKPHQPTIAGRRHYDLHADLEKFELPSPPAHVSPIASGYLRDEPGLQLSEADARLAHQAYYASVSFMDEQVGRVLDALDKQGLADSTLVVFTSDHGYHLGWRGQWAKHDMSEEVMRVPLIVRWPGHTTPDSRTAGIVELLDLFPTFAAAASLPIPETLDGQSFLPQLHDPTSPGKRAAFCDDGRKGRTVRTPNWRLTQRPTGQHELYHLPTDPHEYQNVYANPKNAQIITRLTRVLESELGPLWTASKTRK